MTRPPETENTASDFTTETTQELNEAMVKIQHAIPVRLRATYPDIGHAAGQTIEWLELLRRLVMKERYPDGITGDARIVQEAGQ